MRAVLEEAMTKVPAEQATTVTKAYLAEFILKAAAEGLTSYRGLDGRGDKSVTDHPFDVLIMQMSFDNPDYVSIMIP
jgi:hypothetical protein